MRGLEDLNPETVFISNKFINMANVDDWGLDDTNYRIIIRYIAGDNQLLVFHSEAEYTNAIRKLNTAMEAMMYGE